MIATLAHRFETLSERLAARPVLAGLVLLLTAWISLLWPAAMNGQPFLLHDTTAYIRGAAFPVETLLGFKTEWSAAEPAAVAQTQIASVHAHAASSVADKTVYSGRSVYYGSLLFWGYLIGGLWVPALLQAAIVTAALFSFQLS